MLSIITTSTHSPYLQPFKEQCLRVIEKIAAIAKAIFRYFGSKTWSLPGLCFRLPYLTIKHLLSPSDSLSKKLFGSGYTRFGQKTLSAEQLSTYLPYVFSNTAAINYKDKEWLAGSGAIRFDLSSLQLKGTLPGQLQAGKNNFFDEQSGLRISLFKKGTEVIVVFDARPVGNLGKYTNSRRNRAIADNFMGLVPDLHKQAVDAIEVLLPSLAVHTNNITLCGQCLGGSIASYVGLKKQLKAICLNSLPLGVGLQQDVNDSLTEADRYVTHISTETDRVSHLHWIIGALDAMVNFLGIRTPGNFGKKYVIPTAYAPYSSDTHEFFAGSVMYFLYQDKRAKPCDILGPKPKTGEALSSKPDHLPSPVIPRSSCRIGPFMPY